ncbi:MAG TPA: NAD(P)H-dependent oxidoreductase [Candidatus Acidoferrales bacterium]|nr:NAD(P)H-dependent oxidoreductase [Candidatus Acidoferrales bacterium]
MGDLRVLTGALGRPIAFAQTPIEQVRQYSKEMALMLEWFERVGYSFERETLLKLGSSTSATSRCPSSTSPLPPAMPGTPPYEHEVVKKWTAQIVASDGFILVTPEYNYGPSAVPISSQESNQCLHCLLGPLFHEPCPVSFKSTAVTVVATSFICGPRIEALAFSPAMDRMGILKLVLAICAKSFAVSGHAAK